MKEQVSPQIKTTKEEKCGYFWEKVSDVWKILLGAAAFSAVFNMIFWALEKKGDFPGSAAYCSAKGSDDWAGS